MFLSKNQYTKTWLAGATAIVILSAIMFFQAVLTTNIDTPIRGDARDYLAYAFNLKIHGIYSHSWPDSPKFSPTPDALRAPGYPCLLSIFVDKNSNNFYIENVLFLQAGLGVLTVIIYLLLYRKFMSTGWALSAGLIMSISPHLINASVYILTETLFTCLVGAHLLALERAIRLKQHYFALLAGVLLAASFLTRPTTQYLVLVYLVIVFVWLRVVTRQNWRILVYLLLPVLLATGAWSSRNIIQTGHASDQTLTANFLQHGMYINMMYEGRPETFGYPYRSDPLNSQFAGKPRRVLEAIGQRFLEEPTRYLSWFMIGKPIQFFSWNLTESVGDAFIYAPTYSPYFNQRLFTTTHAIAKTLHPFMMFLGVVGAFLAISRAKNNELAVILISIVMYYFVALHMIGAPFPRYSIPLRPISYGLAFFTLQTLTQWTRVKLKGLK